MTLYVWDHDLSDELSCKSIKPTRQPTGIRTLSKIIAALTPEIS
jgi:hypothetical protein